MEVCMFPMYAFIKQGPLSGVLVGITAQREIQLLQDSWSNPSKEAAQQIKDRKITSSTLFRDGDILIEDPDGTRKSVSPCGCMRSGKKWQVQDIQTCPLHRN